MGVVTQMKIPLYSVWHLPSAIVAVVVAAALRNCLERWRKQTKKNLIKEMEGYWQKEELFSFVLRNDGKREKKMK